MTTKSFCGSQHRRCHHVLHQTKLRYGATDKAPRKTTTLANLIGGGVSRLSRSCCWESWTCHLVRSTDLYGWRHGPPTDRTWAQIVAAERIRTWFHQTWDGCAVWRRRASKDPTGQRGRSIDFAQWLAVPHAVATQIIPSQCPWMFCTLSLPWYPANNTQPCDRADLDRWHRHTCACHSTDLRPFRP